jgi:hypothetical protein
MATVLEIATQAGASADQVLRVVNGEPVSEDVSSRVRAAIALLGAPPYPRPFAREALPATIEGQTADHALERLTDAAAELESTLPLEVGTVVYEAVRVEVRPVVEHVAGLQTLFDSLAGELRLLRREVAAERRDRVDDLALQVELLRTSWVNVDRRLGRIERALARRPAERQPAEQGTLLRLEDRQTAERRGEPGGA